MKSIFTNPCTTRKMSRLALNNIPRDKRKPKVSALQD